MERNYNLINCFMSFQMQMFQSFYKWFGANKFGKEIVADQ